MTEATPMDDLTVTKLCAEAQGYENPNIVDDFGKVFIFPDGHIYQPLRDDAQAIALVKRFNLSVAYLIGYVTGKQEWYCDISVESIVDGLAVHSVDLNRAICECCAKMMLARKGASNDAKAQGGGR